MRLSHGTATRTTSGDMPGWQAFTSDSGMAHFVCGQIAFTQGYFSDRACFA